MPCAGSLTSRSLDPLLREDDSGFSEVSRLSHGDIVRHPLVAEMLEVL